MQFTAAQIAMIITGKVEGDPNASVGSFGKIEEAQAGQLAFLANPKYEDHLYTTKASVIIISAAQELKQPVSATLIRVEDAYTAFATLLTKYQEVMTQQMVGTQDPVYVDPSAKLGENIFLGAFCYIGKGVVLGNNVKIFPNAYIGDKVTIGDNSIIHPGVKIYHDCVLGKNVTVHAGTVLGSDGFGFAPQPDGSFKKVPQIGNVVVEDFVEIGANATIDRATMGSTVIKSGAKLDNLIQIAHNVEVGNNTVIAAQAGVSGSTKLGNNVMIGGQAGIVGHIVIADGARINAQSGVSKSIKTSNSAVTGSPAFDYTSALRSQAVSRNLPDLERRIQELERLVQQLLGEKVD
ncbi:UDP-3-O-(3-hydroxymyristoyl)glucosamine N-acyltransferase [Pseudoflavitalea sp. G-6-1-2]|uniref:UDP-3-O-(3-hydroxymyristoyl)glucosamine N-acyltransferase n=1 Tax=Pseudoflavitalea sp. G-6-1-2 TaxID=2728841 RepID=UPI00146B59B9|nr:UDP-3-O-(3-hydroxymyristoyl)glucosamine N-acyltransferase [Pseudoflavitalea sp. G-6-1-2]NML20550.1 UDP-3-O-(3-hydroxymyristoyl)glucosamine N-acyltransferase [Pseudoflavitalea sp. G-6-1-2]